MKQIDTSFEHNLNQKTICASSLSFFRSFYKKMSWQGCDVDSYFAGSIPVPCNTRGTSAGADTIYENTPCLFFSFRSGLNQSALFVEHKKTKIIFVCKSIVNHIRSNIGHVHLIMPKKYWIATLMNTVNIVRSG